MDARRPCPDSALLAAFLDGTLAEYERTAVVTHLAECPRCRAVALAVVEFQEVEALDQLWDADAAPRPPAPLRMTGTSQWSREKTRAPALAAAAIAAVAAVAGPIYFLLPSWTAQRAVADLFDAAAGHRPIESRVAGVNYAPPPALSGSTPSDRRPYSLVTAAARVRGAYETDYAVPSQRAFGVAALLVGELDDAIASLEVAVTAEPRDSRLSNDLAAAYYERAQRGQRPDDLPAALSAVERALQLNPALVEGWFNRALIITALGLRDEARRAWDAYIERDPVSPWTQEARDRRARLVTADPAAEWSRIRAALAAAPGRAAVETAVTEHATRVRDYIENDLLRRWVDAAKRRDRAAEDAAIGRMRILGQAFADHAGEALYVDLVRSLERARESGPDAHEGAVAAHERFLAGMQAMAASNFPEAAKLLEPAVALLAQADSPLEGRARIDLAATHYYALRYEAAARPLRASRADAERRGYAQLVIRASWLQGLTSFALNDFAGAQVGYEQMLAAAAATRDDDFWVTANVLLANLHEMLGEASIAWGYRVAAASRLDKVLSVSTRAVLLLSASGDASAGGHHAAALLFQSVLAAMSDVPANLAVQVRAQRAVSLHKLGRTSEADSELALARETLPAIADPQGRSRVAADVLAAEAELRLHSDRTAAIAAARQALALPLMQRDSLRRARVQLHLARAALLQGELDGAEAAVNDGLESLERFRSDPSSEFAIRASDAVWSLYPTAAQVALRRGDVPKAFAFMERGRMRTPQERRAWGARPVSLDEVQRSLAPDVALTILNQLDDRLQIWVVRNHEVYTETAPVTRARATALVTAHLQEVLRRAPEPTKSAELFEAVIGQVAAPLASARHVVFVADAPYNRIAFAGLWDRRRDRFLVEDHGVVVAPSATAYVSSAERARGQSTGAGRQASMVGTTGFHGAQGLADRLSAFYGTARFKRALAATPDELLADVSERDVVHVTAPVVVNDQHPALSRFVMSDEAGRKYSGAAFARTLSESSAVRAQLVSFESGAGQGVTARAEGTLGLARALLAAGVPSVVGPVAELDRSSAGETWAEFHRHFATGAGAADSLRRAQLAALNDSDRRPGPWATLTVFGSAQ